MTVTTELSAGPDSVAPTITRVSPRAAVRQAGVMAYRVMLNYRRSPQLLYDAILWPIAGPVLFANLFGIALAGSVRGYLPHMIPGVLVQIVLTAAVATGVHLCEDIQTGVFDRFVSMPVSRLAPVAGTLVAGMLRYVLSGGLVVSTGVAMGYRPEQPIGLLLAVLLVIYCTFAMSWVFATVGILVTKPSAVQGISVMILMTFTFASNAIIPPVAMPDWLRTFTEVNPVSHLVSAVRAAADTGAFTTDAIWSWGVSTAVMLVFAPATVRLIRSRN